MIIFAFNWIMSTIKKIFMWLVIIWIAFCIIADGLYLGIKFFAPAKVIVNTFNVSDLVKKNEDGTTSNLGKIFEFEYWSNTSGNGLEMLEAKFNYLANEKTDNVFSSGIQVIGNENGSIVSYLSIDDNSAKEKGILGLGGYDKWSKISFSNEYEYNFDGNTAYKATLPVTKDNYFLITIGNEQFRLIFKQDSYDFKYYSYQFLTATYTYYQFVDFNFLVNQVFNAIKELPAGFNGTITFKFGDLFEYAALNEETNQYEVIKTDSGTYSLINSQIDNYYTISVKVHADGITNAKDSMFKVVGEDYNFNLGNSQDTSDYTIGKKLICLTQNDFDFVEVENKQGHYNLVLSQTMKDYLQTQSDYLVDISIDTAWFEQNNIVFEEITYDETFSQDLVLKVVMKWLV